MAIPSDVDFQTPPENPYPIIPEDIVNFIVGRRILVGITFYDAGGNKTRKVDYGGTIKRVEQCECIVIETDDGERKIPPTMEGVQFANPEHEYVSRNNGAKHSNVFFVAQYQTFEPHPNHSV